MFQVSPDPFPHAGPCMGAYTASDKAGYTTPLVIQYAKKTS